MHFYKVGPVPEHRTPGLCVTVKLGLVVCGSCPRWTGSCMRHVAMDTRLSLSITKIVSPVRLSGMKKVSPIMKS